jgi:hypothetical protein
VASFIGVMCCWVRETHAAAAAAAAAQQQQQHTQMWLTHAVLPTICRRDAAEREAQEAAAAERERLRNMTEEERLAWLKANRPQVQSAAAAVSIGRLSGLRACPGGGGRNME